MAAPTLSRNAQVLKYFVQATRGIPRKRLMKMPYMSDVVARECLGKPISDFQYMLYKFGPYDASIYDAIAELEAAELAWAKETEAGEEGGLTWKLLFDSGKRVVFDFTAGESEVLAYVAQFYLNMPMDELIHDVIYETAPMKAAEQLKERLRMELLDNAKRDLAGFDLEKLIKAEKQAEAGDFMTAQAFFDALRTNLAARHSGADR